MSEEEFQRSGRRNGRDGGRGSDWSPVYQEPGCESVSRQVRSRSNMEKTQDTNGGHENGSSPKKVVKNKQKTQVAHVQGCGQEKTSDRRFR